MFQNNDWMSPPNKVFGRAKSLDGEEGLFHQVGTKMYRGGFGLKGVAAKEPEVEETRKGGTRTKPCNKLCISAS